MKNTLYCDKCGMIEQLCGCNPKMKVTPPSQIIKRLDRIIELLEKMLK